MKNRIIASVMATFFFALCLMLQFPGEAQAGHMTTLFSTGVLRLADNEKWEKQYTTYEGKFKVRFRKLANSSNSRRYHLIVWWDDKRIADGYCHENYGGYSFDIYQDRSTKRLFLALKTSYRDVLMGYEPWNGRLEKYADSKNFYSPIGNPRMHVDSDGDISLAFIGNGYETPTEYQLYWVEAKRWFGYRDVTYRPYNYEVYYDTTHVYDDEELYYVETNILDD